MLKPHDLLNGFLLVVISSGLSILATLHLVDRKLTDAGSRVMVVNTAEMAKYVGDADQYAAISSSMNARLDDLAARGYVILDGAMVLRFPAAAALNPVVE